jgi:PKD repeat protein
MTSCVQSAVALTLAALLLSPLALHAQDVRIESVTRASETSTVFFTAHFSGEVDLGPPGAMIRPTMARPGGGTFNAVGQEPYEIVWTFGDGTPPVNTGTRPTVSHVFGQQGAYTVTVEVKNARRTVSTWSRRVMVDNVAPRIAPITSVRLDDAPRTLELTGRVTDTPKDVLTWRWDFGDGTTETGQDLWRVRHTWQQDGTYPVTLTVTDADSGRHEMRAEVTVGERPEARTSAETTRAEVPVTRFAGTTSGAIGTTLEATVKPIAGLYLRQASPGVCRFVFSAWDPTTLAYALFRADLRNLRDGGAQYRVQPQFTIGFHDTLERYRASERGLSVDTMGAALSGLSGLAGIVGGTPVEARERIGVDPAASAPAAPDERQAPARSPLGLDDVQTFRYAGGTVDLVVHTHDRAEATFDVMLENTDDDAAGAMRALSFRGSFSLDLQAARRQGIVSYDGCASAPFTIRSTSPDDDARHERSGAEPRVSFSAPYDPRTLDDTTFQLGFRDPAGLFVPVPARIARGERLAVLVPDAPLLGGVRYEARVKTGPDGVRGRNGEELEDPSGEGYHAWSFHSRLVFRHDEKTSLSHNLSCHVLQTVRDAPLIRNKPAVARIYADWAQHPAVHADDQLQSFNGRVTLKDASGTTLASTTHEFVRPDLWASRGLAQANAEHTANLYGWSPQGHEGRQVRVEIEAETAPGAWEPIYHTRCPANYWTPEPTLKIDYYQMAIGDWFPWPPESTISTLHTIYSKGEQFALQVFPLQSVQGRYRGTMVMGPGMHAQLLGARVLFRGEPIAQNAADILASELTMSYARQHATDADLVLGFGPSPFLSGGTADVSLAQGARGAIRSMFNDDPGLRDRYIHAWVHEVGHYLLLDHIPYYTEAADLDSLKVMRDAPDFQYDGIEGFRILPPGWTGWNKSSTEGNGEGPRIVPLMFPASVPYRNTFIATHHYHKVQQLIERNNLFAARRVAASSPVLFASTSIHAIPAQAGVDAPRQVGVAGYIDQPGASAWLGPLVGRTALPDPQNAGAYELSLLDGSGSVVGSTRFDVATSTHAEPTGAFQASLQWSDTARSLVLSKDGAVLARRDRSTHAPMVTMTSPTPAQRADGDLLLTWEATDADGDPLQATVLYSSDAGDTGWSTLAMWLDSASFTVDTAGLEPGPTPTFRVVVNDGFDEADARVSVRIEGRLAALATVPVDDVDGDTRPSMQVLFNTDVAPDSVERARVTWRPEAPSRGSNAVTGSVHYDVDARRMTLTPTADLVPGVRYVATLDGPLVSRDGHPLSAPVTWTVEVASR